MERAFGTAPPDGCDKIEMIFSALASVAKSHEARLVAVNFPGSWQLLGPKPSSDICGRAGAKGIPCLDLKDAIRDASRRGGTSLFIDGSHLNEVGSAFAAKQIAEWLRRLPVTERSPTPAGVESPPRKVFESR